jgi:hypothetical protein
VCACRAWELRLLGRDAISACLHGSICVFAHARMYTRVGVCWLECVPLSAFVRAHVCHGLCARSPGHACRRTGVRRSSDSGFAIK